jgi:hypothetical protein
VPDPAPNPLLEISPLPVDGGARIGRNPRSVKPAEWVTAGISRSPLLKVIRAKCLDCCCYVESEVRKCTATGCPLWPYRMSKNPFRTVSAKPPPGRQPRLERRR